jgi:hypothetical protein
MKVKFSTIGAEIEFEAVNEKEVIKELAFWQSLPDKCGLCGEGVKFDYRNVKDNIYYNIICNGKTRHEFNLGQYRSGGGLYSKHEWKVGFNQENGIPQNDAPSDTTNRIAKAEEALSKLGQTFSSFDPKGKSEEELTKRLNELIAQYKTATAKK